ncbi:MAG: sugar ABC transporter substrate-binding protein, partial [Acetobacteraceae bacterium]|nr:sugar ABC transporter substrate-binding protein [Acetobacteraceae bacterium]
MSEERDLSHVARRAMLHGGSLGAALALFGNIATARAADAGPFPSHPRWKLVFVNHVTTNPF